MIHKIRKLFPKRWKIFVERKDTDYNRCVFFAQEIVKYYKF